MTTDMMMKTQNTIGEYEVDLGYLKSCVDDFIDSTFEARAMSEKCRDYYDGRQWTEDQIKALKKRKQAPVVNNRIKVKHNGLLGILALKKTEPKVYPRNQVDSDTGAAEAATDGLTYVADRNKLNSVLSSAADNYFCEGYCGVHIPVEQKKNGEIKVVVEPIEWDRLFFDPYSRKADFSDARGKGFKVWMDEDDIRTTYGDNLNEDALAEPETNDEEFFEDKPEWFNRSEKRKRYLVATHYFLIGDVWYYAVYTASGFLEPPVVSPYLDEEGEPTCPLELEHAYIDRDNNRYGELKSLLDLQDEINHRRSKALFLLSQRQTYGNKGAVNDVKKAKSELAKPNGHLEVKTGEFGKDFGVLPTGDMAQGQMEMYSDAKAEIDAQSYNAQMAGERQMGDLSGIALKRLQTAGIIELNTLFEQFSEFRLRIFKQIWWRVRQFWTEEKWVRVTDDMDDLRWIGFNVPMPLGKALQEIMDDESKPYEMRLGASARMITLEQQNPQALEQVIEVKNQPAELDMDIMIDETFDFINASEEQLDAILKFGAQQQFDIVDLLEISNIRHKDKLIERIETRRKDAAEAAAQQGPDPQAMFLQGQMAKDQADAQKKVAETEQTQVETQIMQQNAAVASVTI